MALLGLQHVHFQNIPKAMVRWGAATPEITRWTPCTGKPARIQRASLAKSFPTCFLGNKLLVGGDVFLAFQRDTFCVGGEKNRKQFVICLCKLFTVLIRINLFGT